MQTEINFITALLPGLIALIFSFIVFEKYLTSRSKSKFFETLFFLLFGLGWTFNSFGIYNYELNFVDIGSIFIKLGVSFLGLGAFAQITLASMLFSPKKTKFWSIISLILGLLQVLMMFTNPISFQDGDFEYHPYQKISIYSNLIISLIATSFFLIFSIRSKNKLISKKTLFFGLGLLMTTLGSALAALVNAFILTILIRIFIITLGASLFFIGSSLN